ncbi:hypothetical protein D3C73_1047190 [compost metagenome]
MKFSGISYTAIDSYFFKSSRALSLSEYMLFTSKSSISLFPKSPLSKFTIAAFISNPLLPLPANTFTIPTQTMGTTNIITILA